MTELRLDWATSQASRLACRRWHYAGKSPVFKAVRVGVWEDDEFRGVVLFGQGATPNIGEPFGLTQLEVCELVRVALRSHVTPVSRIVALSMRLFLRRQCPGIRLVISFADPVQNHHGGIYQAGNWVYLGQTPPLHVYRVNGEDVHPKTLHSRYGVGGQSVSWLRKNVDPAAERVMLPGKHKYAYPLDRNIRGRLKPKPYPCAGSETSDTPGDQPGEGGAAPTPALQQ